ncbi:MAG: hypothetical protein KF857_04640 [Fimbriimonadaceae bacterium]|nr:hypothetical protein [Fimbriimonadaceae bacterium]
MRHPFARAAFAALVLSASALCLADLRVEVGGGRSRDDVSTLVEGAARIYNHNLAVLSAGSRRLHRSDVVFSQPVRAWLTVGGEPLRGRATGRGRGRGPITLQFETSGSRAFPSAYKAFLQSVFAAATPTLDTIFGQPLTSGVVKVQNYDADLPDRAAVSGGVFVPNGAAGMEIHFPVYQNDIAAAVNFIHTLLLAYTGTTPYPGDVYEEGFVRAATMAACRVPGVIPNNPTAQDVESVLDGLYDASAEYDWSNQPGLGGPAFIAPNLVSTPLPVGGSTGGVYLLRFKMAGTAWAKVLAQYPTFIARFNTDYATAPAAYQTPAAVAALGQQVIDDLAGHAGATVEGRSFADWTQRQWILDTRLSPGLKLVAEAVPVPPSVSDDFGVFGVILNAFKVDSAGNETLLSGRCYPLYWRPEFTRFFMTAQDDILQVGNGYGSVVPNFGADLFANSPYRVTVDLPFGGKVARVVLPAGAVATADSPVAKNVYGTITGVPADATVYSVVVDWVGGSNSVQAQNLAFGMTIADPNFEKAQSVTVKVFKIVSGSVTELFSRVVNKGFGPLALDLRTPACDATFTLTRGAKQALVGLPLEPYRTNAADVFGMPDSTALVARYNPVLARYDLYPDEGEVRAGLGFFIRPATAGSVTVKGLINRETPTSVALRPGWNMVTCPDDASLGTADVQVTQTSQSVGTWAQAAGTLLGNTFFKWTPDPVNPDLGTFVPATTFDPGVGYFVRALDADGAVLVFTPKTRGRGTRAFHPGTEATSGAWPTKWSADLVATSSAGNYSVCTTAASAAGTLDDNPRFDDKLPPSPGGFQMSVESNGDYYRKLWPASRRSFTLKLTGLRPGVLCTLRAPKLAGAVALNVQLPGGRVRPLTPWSAVTFASSTSTLFLKVTAK